MVSAQRCQIGDGYRVPTMFPEDDGEKQCPHCKNWYQRIGTHWTKSSTCEHPPISEYKKRLLKGMIIGDGSLNTQHTPYVDISMVNKTFLEWLNEELGWFGSGVSQERTASDSYEYAQTGSEISHFTQIPKRNFHDVYRLRTLSHPSLSYFNEWYNEGSIYLPKKLRLSPTALKMLYVSDGSLNIEEGRSGSVSIISGTQVLRPEAMWNAFEEIGIHPRTSPNKFSFDMDDTERFFEYIGDPVPGFEYKWAWKNYDQYKELQSKLETEHRTKTLD